MTIGAVARTERSAPHRPLSRACGGGLGWGLSRHGQCREALLDCYQGDVADVVIHRTVSARGESPHPDPPPQEREREQAALALGLLRGARHWARSRDPLARNDDRGRSPDGTKRAASFPLPRLRGRVRVGALSARAVSRSATRLLSRGRCRCRHPSNRQRSRRKPRPRPSPARAGEGALRPLVWRGTRVTYTFSSARANRSA
jgi:hypothetical protein